MSGACCSVGGGQLNTLMWSIMGHCGSIGMLPWLCVCAVSLKFFGYEFSYMHPTRKAIENSLVQWKTLD